VFGTELVIALSAIFCLGAWCLLRASVLLREAIRSANSVHGGGVASQAEAAVAEAVRLMGLNERTHRS
jgi:hypothetical protein